MHITWKPDRNSSKTLHAQIHDYFLERIGKGDWPAGTRLPAERKLADMLGVNRSTIASVLDELRANDMLISRGRQGTFVSGNSWSVLASYAQPNWSRYIDGGIHMPNQQIIQQINTYEFQDGIVRLGTGEPSPSLFPTDLMDQVMGRVTRSMAYLSYEEPKGQLALRQEICRHLSTYALQVLPEQVLIVSGSLQAFGLIANGLLQPGSRIYTEKPSYLKSLNIFQSAGMHLKGIPMDEQGIDLSQLRDQMRPRGTNLLYTIPTYHNPTGRLMSEERRRELITLVQDLRLPVIEDDAYRELWLDTPPPNPLKSVDEMGNVIYTGTLSKSFAPGIRIGWVVGPQPVIDRLGDLKMQTDYGSSSVSQLIATEWLGGGHHRTYQERLRNVLRRRRQVMLDELSRSFGEIATWQKPAGGFYVWLQLKKRVNQTSLFQRLLDENILINPGNIYDYDDSQAIRLSFAYASEEELRWALPRLAYWISIL